MALATSNAIRLQEEEISRFYNAIDADSIDLSELTKRSVLISRIRRKPQKESKLQRQHRVPEMF